MPACAIVEFEWDEAIDREGFFARYEARPGKRHVPMAA
jgi:hypothetical protein